MPSAGVNPIFSKKLHRFITDFLILLIRHNVLAYYENLLFGMVILIIDARCQCHKQL